MRTLLVTAGSWGDVQPILLLGRRLCARGHEVTLAAQESHEAAAARAGLAYVPLAGRALELLHSDEGRALVAASSVRHGLEVWAGELRRVEEAWASSLVGLVEAADVVVSGLLAAVVPSEAARVAGRPHAVVLPFPFEPAWLPQGEHLFTRVVERSFLEPHRAWLERRRAGLARPSMLDELMAGGARMLRAWSPTIYPAPPGVDDPALAPIGAFTPGEDDAESLGLLALPEPTVRWLAEGEPPIFVGFGSMPVPGGAAFANAVAATVEATGRRAIVQGTWSDEVKEAYPGGTLHAVGPCDHAALLPRCAAAIHHAGAGTTHAVVRAGLPSVACPVLGDQFVWARRLVELGAGEALPARRELVVALPGAASRTLDEGPGRSARALAEGLAREDGLAAAVARIEAMVP